jgi:hypothetical protein
LVHQIFQAPYRSYLALFALLLGFFFKDMFRTSFVDVTPGFFAYVFVPVIGVLAWITIVIRTP